MENKQFLRVEEVATFMGISVPTAYKIIRQMNKDMELQGYLTIAGRIDRAYFEQKVFYCKRSQLEVAK